MTRDLGGLVLANYQDEADDPDDAVTLIDELLEQRRISSADIFQLMKLAYELGQEESST